MSRFEAAQPVVTTVKEAVEMSERVQAILEAVRDLDIVERHELASAMTVLEDDFRNCSQEDRRKLIEAIQGSFRDARTSSEEFMKRKQEDLDLEFRWSR